MNSLVKPLTNPHILSFLYRTLDIRHRKTLLLLMSFLKLLICNGSRRTAMASVSPVWEGLSFFQFNQGKIKLKQNTCGCLQFILYSIKISIPWFENPILCDYSSCYKTTNFSHTTPYQNNDFIRTETLLLQVCLIRNNLELDQYNQSWISSITFSMQPTTQLKFFTKAKVYSSRCWQNWPQ